MKKKIIHIINDLRRGGAETMLVATLKELNEYDNIIVTFNSANHFEGELKHCRFISLDLFSIAKLPLYISKLRSIIKEEQPAAVHTHLYWPTILARFATPKNIPLISTVHSSVKYSTDYKKAYIRIVDRISFSYRKSIIIGVANGILEQYFSMIGKMPYRSYVLYTFVDTRIFNASQIVVHKEKAHTLKLITVGSLRDAKNQLFLIQCFRHLKNENIELDIFGDGDLKETLQNKIKASGVKVYLKGAVKNIQDVLPQYDLVTMACIFEGFSLSILEAMALKMPLLLSDIPSFKEQCDAAVVQ